VKWDTLKALIFVASLTSMSIVYFTSSHLVAGCSRYVGNCSSPSLFASSYPLSLRIPSRFKSW
jgi:hypothetical protein